MTLGLNTTDSTLYRWLKKNDRLLTTADSLNIISKHLGLNPCDLYEEEKVLTKNVSELTEKQ
jgi:hypothetical protein